MDTRKGWVRLGWKNVSMFNEMHKKWKEESDIQNATHDNETKKTVLYQELKGVSTRLRAKRIVFVLKFLSLFPHKIRAVPLLYFKTAI